MIFQNIHWFAFFCGNNIEYSVALFRLFLSFLVCFILLCFFWSCLRLLVIILLLLGVYSTIIQKQSNFVLFVSFTYFFNSFYRSLFSFSPPISPFPLQNMHQIKSMYDLTQVFDKTSICLSIYCTSKSDFIFIFFKV